ncbi:MAG: hypothetical protein DRH08_00615 [Deltaproteobacteria bacterium]|nr:MAG: hypothetical protein DRH08_00615 [Deltaproteobacteria bacterium]
MMGSRTSLQGNIYHLNEADPKDVLELLVSYGITGTDYDVYTVDEYANIPTDGLNFTEWDMRCGTANEVASDLVELDVTFMLWEDPAQEWLGELHMHHPTLGVFAAQCDADGNALMQDYMLKRLMGESVVWASIVARADRLLGVTYQKKFAKLVNDEKVST